MQSSETISAPTAEPRPAETLTPEAWLRRTLRAGPIANPYLDIAFQPVVDLRNGAIVGAEALARFRHDPYRTPDLWFADAERMGIGMELELLAIEIALQSLERMPPDTYLAVNASPETIASRALFDVIGRFPTDRIVVELTEHAPVTDYATVETAIAELRGRGTRLAIDDAGAGFSSLQHILRLRPDLIKLDRSLTSGVDKNPVRFALASALVTFAASLGARICAEGIETLGEVVTMQRLGVRKGQGYFLGRPGALPMGAPPEGIWLSKPGAARPDDDAGIGPHIASPAVRSETRLAALRATGLLDTEAEAEFDRVTTLVTNLLHAPVALLSLVDENRNFFKSHAGPVPVRQVGLDRSFCRHAVTNRTPLVVGDASLHPLVQDNPVIHELGVRAYVGVPILTSENEAIGALCALDMTPREWSDGEVETLRALAHTVATMIDLRKRNRALEYRAALVDTLLEDSDLPVIVGAFDGLIERASVAMCSFLGRTESSLQAMRTLHFTHPDDRRRLSEVRSELLEGNVDRINFEARFMAANGAWTRRNVRVTLVRDGAGSASFFVLTLLSGEPVAANA